MTGGPRTIDEYAEQHGSRLSRLRVSRRGLVLGGGAAAAAGIVLGLEAFRSAGGVAGRQGPALSGRQLARAPDLGPSALRLTAQVLPPSVPAGLRAVHGDRPGHAAPDRRLKISAAAVEVGAVPFEVRVSGPIGGPADRRRPR